MNRQHPDHSRAAFNLDAIALRMRERAELEAIYGPPYDVLIDLHVEPVKLPDARVIVWIDAIADVTRHDGPFDPDPEIHGIKVIEVGDAAREYQLSELTERDKKKVADAVECEALRRIN